MRLGILIRDREYRSAILEMISEFDRDIFVEVANENGAGRESIILTDVLPEELSSEQLARLIHRTVFLTPNRVSNEDGIHRAFKYADISEIIGEVFMLYSDWTGDSGINHPFSRTISVCSSTDSLAAEHCRILARSIIYEHGGSVLILPLGYINDYSNLVSVGEDIFKRMMYLIDSGKSFPIESFSETDCYGITYLKLHGKRNPISSLDISYLNQLIRGICNKFDTVIFDLGTCYRKENIAVVEISDTVICLENTRISDYSEFIGQDSVTRAKHVLEDGVSDMTIMLTDLVKEMYSTEGVMASDKGNNN